MADAERIELFESGFVRITPAPAEDGREQGNDRVQRTVGVKRRTVALQVAMRFLIQVRDQSLHQARFADSGIAGHQHHLATTFAHLLPAIAKQAQFRGTSDEGPRLDFLAGSCVGTLARIMRAEPVPGWLLLDDPPSAHWDCESAKRYLAQVLPFEQV